MSTTDTERYIRITLLTFEGGTWICKEILIREVNRLIGHPTLDAVLLYNKARFTQKRDRKEITQRQYETLFPSSGTDTDIDEWDLSLIIKVVLLLFEKYLPRQESDDIREILRIRNEVLCHATQPSVEERDFNRHWAALTLSISGLAYDARTKTHASDLVKKLSGDPLDLQSSIDKVAELCRHDEHMENVLASLTKLERRLNEVATGVVNANTKLDYVLVGVRELQRSHEVDMEAQCRVEIPLLESTVCLSGKNEGEVKMSENIILKVLRAAITNAEDPKDNDNVRKAVNESLEDLKRKGGHTESAENGSIILKIRCYTLKDLETFLCLFLTTGHRFRLTRIESALNALLEDVIKVELVLPEATIDILRGWIEDQVHEYKRTIKLGIRCESAEAAVDVIRYLQSSDSANRMNQIAEAVSEVVHDQIKIEATPDIEGFAQALNANIASTKLSVPVTDRPASQAGTSSELMKQPEHSTDVPYETVLPRHDSNPLQNELHDENVTSTETQKCLKDGREEEEVATLIVERNVNTVQPEEQIVGSEEHIQQMKKLSIAKASELTSKAEKRMFGMDMMKRISGSEIEKRLVKIEGRSSDIREQLQEIGNRLQGYETSMFESEKRGLTSEMRMLESEKQLLESENQLLESEKRALESEKEMAATHKLRLERMHRSSTLREIDTQLDMEAKKRMLESEKPTLDPKTLRFEHNRLSLELERMRLGHQKWMLKHGKRELSFYNLKMHQSDRRSLEFEKEIATGKQRSEQFLLLNKSLETKEKMESDRRRLEFMKEITTRKQRSEQFLLLNKSLETKEKMESDKRGLESKTEMKESANIGVL